MSALVSTNSLQAETRPLVYVRRDALHFQAALGSPHRSTHLLAPCPLSVSGHAPGAAPAVSVTDLLGAGSPGRGGWETGVTVC